VNGEFLLVVGLLDVEHEVVHLPIRQIDLSPRLRWIELEQLYPSRHLSLIIASINIRHVKSYEAD